MSKSADVAMEELATSLAHMARELSAQESVDSTLDGIVSHAVDMVDGCEAASIMVLNRKRQLSTLAATNEVGPESNRIQTRLGEGPCFDVADQKQEILRSLTWAPVGSAGHAMFRRPAP